MITDDRLGGPTVLDLWLPPKLSILDRWEHLRIVYNAVLVLETALLTIDGSTFIWWEAEFWWFVLPCAFMANLCYFAGPAFEAVCNRARPTSSRFTRVLFGWGLAFSMFLTLVMIMGWRLDQID